MTTNKLILWVTLVVIAFGAEAKAQRTFVSASAQYTQRAYTDASVQTWAAWTRLSTTNVLQPIICTMRGWDTSHHYRLIMYNLGVFYATERAGGSPASSISNLVPEINTWIHLAARFNGTANRTLFVNGVACATETTAVIPTDIDEVYLGRVRTLTTQYFGSSTIAEPAIWHVALTDSEVAQLASGGAFARRASPSKIRPDKLVWLPDLTIPGAAVPGVGGVTGISNSPALLTVLPPAFR